MIILFNNANFWQIFIDAFTTDILKWIYIWKGIINSWVVALRAGFVLILFIKDFHLIIAFYIKSLVYFMMRILQSSI